MKSVNIYTVKLNGVAGNRNNWWNTIRTDMQLAEHERELQWRELRSGKKAMKVLLPSEIFTADIVTETVAFELDSFATTGVV